MYYKRTADGTYDPIIGYAVIDTVFERTAKGSRPGEGAEHRS
jgi:hypothetical protein